MQLSALKVWSAPLLLLVTTGTMALSISPYNSSIDFNHTLSKRDPSGVPADIFSEGCALKNPKFAVPKSNPGIQVGECYVNSRIMKQKFCIFEPDAARITASLEGGPYGTCSCYDQFPKATDLMSFENLNYACMAWTKNSGGGTAPAIPGTKCIPFPIVCPTSLIKSSKGCYSKNYFAQGGPVSMLQRYDTLLFLNAFLFSFLLFFQGDSDSLCKHQAYVQDVLVSGEEPEGQQGHVLQ